MKGKKKDAKKAEKKKPDLLETLEKSLGKGVIVRADEVASAYHIRMPTGIPSLDQNGLAGGFPCGTVVEIAGPPSAGKTALTYQTAAELQRRKGKNARILICNAEGAMDKGFARKLGFIVPYSPDEILILERKNGTPFTKEEKAELQRSVCPVDFIDEANSADEILTAVIKAAATDEYDLILVDSVASLIAQEDLIRKVKGQECEVMVGDEKAYHRAINGVINSFCNRWFLIVRSSKPKGRPNMTVCLMVNQVRANMNAGYGGFDWKVGGAYGLKHAKAGSIWVFHGKGIKKGEKKVGRFVHWLIDKAKYDIRPESKGQMPYYTDSGFDPVQDLFLLLKGAGLFKHTGGGAWCLSNIYGEVVAEYDSSFGGEEGVIEAIRGDADAQKLWMGVYESLYPSRVITDWEA